MWNKPVTCLVHRLVAASFLPAPKQGQDCVCHRDDNPANNHASNLFWGTRADNNADKVAKGRQSRGERTRTAKLTAAAVIEIRRRAASGQTQRRIAADFGISQSNVSMAVSGVTWGHVS